MRIENNHLLLNSLVNKEAQSTPLKVGESYYMTFVKNDRGSNMFQYKGQMFNAQISQQAQAQLKEGAQVRVLLESVSNNILNLKIVNEPKHNLSIYAVKDFKKIIEDFQLPTTKINYKIVEAMLRHSIPLTSQNMTIIQSYMAQNPDNQSNSLMALIFLMERNLPINNDMIDQILSYLSSKEKIGMKYNTLSKNTLNANDEESLDFAQIEKDLDAYIIKNNNLSIKRTITQFEGANGISQNIFEQSQSVLNNHQLKIPSHLKDIFEHIILQGIVNKPNQNNLPYYYYQLPIQWTENISTLEVFYLNNRHFHSAEELDSNRFVLGIDTQQLGHMIIDVQNLNQNLNIKLGVENNQIEKIIKHHKNELKQLLTEISYTINSFNVITTEQPTATYVESILEMPRKVNQLV